jgi:hypothetical protein
MRRCVVLRSARFLNRCSSVVRWREPERNRYVSALPLSYSPKADGTRTRNLSISGSNPSLRSATLSGARLRRESRAAKAVFLSRGYPEHPSGQF